MGDATDWVAGKLAEDPRIQRIDRTLEGFLVVNTTDDYNFLVAVIGARDVIRVSDVQPLIVGNTKPDLVVNVPSETLWSGAAINFVHAIPAGFGTLGDIYRAAEGKNARFYRDKGIGFFITAISQHENVVSVSYVYNTVLEVRRKDGAITIVAVIDAYNMAAEDVRNAKERFGYFDVVVKSSSYGSITKQAAAAAGSMSAQALTFRELMQHLSK